MARVRWYEAAALANAALVAGLIVGRSGVAFDVLASVRAQLPMLGVSAALLAAGVGLRALLVAAGGGASRSRLYLSRIASPRSLSELARFALTFTLVAYGYSWLKVFVPRLHATVFDPALAVLDQLLHFGLNPNRFAVELFPFPGLFRFLDLYYAQFFATLLFAVAWFGSALSIRERTRFAAGLAVLWIGGAWWYLATPSLGPCYVFPGDTASAQPHLPLQTGTQRLLFDQYRALTGGRPEGKPVVLNAAFGIGAMPSLHVAAQAFVAFFARRRHPWIGFLFALFTVLTFFGSLVTGWHYAVDGYAGVLLAWVAYRAGLRSA